MPKHVTEKDFQMEVLESEIPVMVDFWAEWCFPCKTIAPLVDELSKEYSGKLKVVKVDVDSSNRVAADYMIMSIPSLLIFKEGKSWRQSGVRSTRKPSRLILKGFCNSVCRSWKIPLPRR